MLYPVIFCTFAAFVAVVLLQNSYILLEYARKDENDNLVLSLYTFGGLFRYKYEVPFINLGRHGIESRMQKKRGKKEKVKSDEEKTFGLKEFIERYLYLVELKKNFEVSLNYLRKKLRTKEFDLDMDIGTGDPFNTAIATGIAWSAVGILTSCLIDKKNEAKKRVRIRSNFVENDIKVDLYCIFCIRIVHIIVVAFKFLTRLVRRKFSAKKILGGDISG